MPCRLVSSLAYWGDVVRRSVMAALTAGVIAAGVLGMGSSAYAGKVDVPSVGTDLVEVVPEGGECHICLAEFADRVTAEKAQDLRQLDCGHVFDRACIEQWVKSDNYIGDHKTPKCPTCRQEINTQSDVLIDITIGPNGKVTAAKVADKPQSVEDVPQSNAVTQASFDELLARIQPLQAWRPDVVPNPLQLPSDRPTGVAANDNTPFHSPRGVAVNFGGRMLIADTANNRVFQVSLEGPSAQVATSSAVRVDTHGNTYISEGNRLFRIAPDGAMTTIAGTG